MAENPYQSPDSNLHQPPYKKSSSLVHRVGVILLVFGVAFCIIGSAIAIKPVTSNDAQDRAIFERRRFNLAVPIIVCGAGIGLGGVVLVCKPLK
jgi:hypothetical protein